MKKIAPVFIVLFSILCSFHFAQAKAIHKDFIGIKSLYALKSFPASEIIKNSKHCNDVVIELADEDENDSDIKKKYTSERTTIISIFNSEILFNFRPISKNLVLSKQLFFTYPIFILVRQLRI